MLRRGVKKREREYVSFLRSTMGRGLHQPPELGAFFLLFAQKLLHVFIVEQIRSHILWTMFLSSSVHTDLCLKLYHIHQGTLTQRGIWKEEIYHTEKYHRVRDLDKWQSSNLQKESAIHLSLHSKLIESIGLDLYLQCNIVWVK